MLIEPSFFLGFYDRDPAAVVSPSRKVTTSSATAAASCTTSGASASTVASSYRGHPWLEVQWSRIFPCLPQTKPPTPKTSNFNQPTDIHFTTISSATLLTYPVHGLSKSAGMPYTPPSHRSPASTAPSTPDASRRSSCSGSSGSSRPALPRSASYLARHRRTPSAPTSLMSPPQLPVADASTPDITPPGTSDDLKGMMTAHSSVRQSPPPVADSRLMPPGAIISPPESASEDEGQGERDDRGRQIEELKEAISAIPQHRESSPGRTDRTSPGHVLVLPSQIGDIAEKKLSLTANLPALDTGARKVSHGRSRTDSHIVFKPEDSSVLLSEENSGEDEPIRKPQMVRKKSGELVRPALRPASHRRPSSMPGTPTFSKAVHFDSHLEHVRHFLQVDRPLAVSANTSPNENYESDTEYPFGQEEKGSNRPATNELEIDVHNFPPETALRKAQPVRLERLWMSADKKSLMGTVAVANLAFNKLVVCRFTFDYWKTTSEVIAEYAHEIRPKFSDIGHDRFQFSIKLSDLANLESKTLYLCIRYNVNGLEYWDNNNHVNFQVDFRKKSVPQDKGRGSQSASPRSSNALPRSNRRSPSTAPPPKSMPVGVLDEFDHDAKLSGFDRPIHEFLGESRPTSLRLKSSKSATALPSDNLANKLPTPSGQAFANRYDFGASLTAAMQARKESAVNRRSDGLYMKPHRRVSSNASPSETPRTQTPTPAPLTKGDLLPVSGTGSPSGSIASASYEEILNKYCFYGSKSSSPQPRDGTMRHGRFDGMDDLFTRSTNSTNSSSTGSPQMAENHHLGAMHHSLHQSIRQNLSPYFPDSHVSAIGASPAVSPLQNPSSMSPRSMGSADSSTPKVGSSSPAAIAGFAPLAGDEHVRTP
ncbi:hypothetical protein DL767_009018 [Monosporascus sp. MG133]|nr:hypothetical protein DL767_009018 [Monosporascus sp. MG133]